MGDFRFYMCPAGLLSAELVMETAPDHGLIWMLDKRRVKVMVPAPRREYAKIDKDAEIRYLRFAIINNKTPYGPPVVESVEQGALRLNSGEVV